MMDWIESSSFRLEGRVCTACAPGCQEKSIDGKFKQALRGVMSTSVLDASNWMGSCALNFNCRSRLVGRRG
jgi:hypothetical protein